MRLYPILCPIMANPVLVEPDDAQGPTHSRHAEYGSRRAIQARSDDANSGLSLQRSFIISCRQAFCA